MNAMKLSYEYFNNIAAPRLEKDFPEVFKNIAAGLVGNGSECFGYDDEISRDHDWGVDFFLWVTEEDKELIPILHQWKLDLTKAVPPVFTRSRSEYGARIGAMTVGNFYSQLIGQSNCPETIEQWRRIPEENLAMAVNGEIFWDGAGEFTKIRNELLRFFPEDIRKKKIAARCMGIAQTGQYNLQRCLKRGDNVTARTILSKFNDNVIAIIFLLNKIYRPYYKWAFRRMTELPILGNEVGLLLKQLSEIGKFDQISISLQEELISDVCEIIIKELNRQQLAFSDDWFLTSQGEEIQRSIVDPSLRSLPAQYE